MDMSQMYQRMANRRAWLAALIWLGIAFGLGAPVGRWWWT
jgi:hypothetical protein